MPLIGHHLVIRNGEVHDGRGAPGRIADAAVRGGRIVAVGEVRGRGTEGIDAVGRIVTRASSMSTPIMTGR